MGKIFNRRGFLERLEQLRATVSLSKGDFGKLVGVTNIFSRYSESKTGEMDRKIKAPSVATLLRISEIFNVSVDWLLTGEGVPFPGQAEPGVSEAEGLWGQTKRQAVEGQAFDITEFEAEPGVEAPAARAGPGAYVYIPLYNVEATAGGGAVVETEQVVDFLAFKREWVHRELGASPQDLYLLYIDGDSMEPSLRPGDIVLIDRRDGEISRDGIYILRLDSGLLVKRLQRLPGGVIQVTSDNMAYQPFTIRLDKPPSDLAVIGRVVWMGRRV